MSNISSRNQPSLWRVSSYYVSSASLPDAILSPQEASNTALAAFIGTLAAGLTWGGSNLVNRLMARCKDLRYLTAAGAGCMCAGYALAGFSTLIWHLLLTQGLLSGIGSSLFYFPILSTAPEYFDIHRGAALGLILSGAGMGGLALWPLTNVLLSRIGPRWTLRALGLPNLAVGMPTALATAPGRSATRRPTLVNVKLTVKPAFILQAAAALLQAAGDNVPNLSAGIQYFFGIHRGRRCATIGAHERRQQCQSDPDGRSG